MKTRIHVNRQYIAQNKKYGTNKAVITAKTYKDNRYGHEVIIKGPSKIVYRPDRPLSCGAVLWIETDGEVEVISNET